MVQQGSQKVCFVIAPIGAKNSLARSKSDKVLREIIEPATKICGYKAQRADQSGRPGIIIKDVIIQVSEAPLVIANLTDQNANVFYELALRHTLEKPVILIIPEDQDLPFDVHDSRAIFFDLEDKVSVKECREEIIKQIRAIEQSSENYDNPISMAIDIQRLRSNVSFNPEDVRKAFEQVSNLEVGIEKFDVRAVCNLLEYYRIKTKGELIRLLSPEILNTVGLIYHEELQRPEDKLLDILGIITWGSHFLYNGITDKSIDYIRERVRDSDEYRQISGGLIIAKALYGASGTWEDVTDKVKSYVRNNSLSLPVGNDTLGIDPLYGKRKQLIVTYFFNQQIYVKKVDEDETLQLP